MKKAREGDRTALHTLITKHEFRVAATVIGMIGPGPEAEDIGQDTFIRFFKAIDRFRGQSTVGTYLTRIAINLCLDEIKRRQRRRNRFFSYGGDQLDNMPASTNAENKRDAQSLVQWGLRRLNPKYRSVLVLRLIDGYSVAETAKILKIPTGTVLSRLARGQEKLKKILDPVYREDQDSGEENE